MAVPTNRVDLSATLASNSPLGSEVIGANVDNYIRALAGFIRQGEHKGADVASATSLTIPDTGSYFDVTGTTTVEGISSTASWDGRLVILQFDGALQLTHSSTFTLPGSANCTTAAGDFAIFVQETSGTWRCLHYYDATVSQAELQTLDGLTASTAELNTLDGITASTAELNILDGVTATATELNRTDGLTSPIVEDNDIGSTVQAYDANLTSFVSTFTLPTSDGTNNQVLQTDGAGNLTLVSLDPGTLPTKTGNAGKVLKVNSGETGVEWGAAGGVIQATASGAITAGDLVKVNSDGTVSAIDTSGYGDIQTPVKINTTTGIPSSAYQIRATYDTTNNKLVYLGHDGASAYLNVFIGSVTGKTISWGSGNQVTTVADTAAASIVYDSTNDRIVVTYEDASTDLYAVVGTITGTSVSFGTPVQITTNDTSFVGSCFDSTNGKVVIAYDDRTATDLKAVVGTVSGTSISFGTIATVVSSIDCLEVQANYDSNAGKVLIAYADTTNGNGSAIVGTVSGTTISFGTKADFYTTDEPDRHRVAFDTTNNKFVIAYHDSGSVDKVKVKSATISGTDVTFGAEYEFPFDTNQGNRLDITYAPSSGCFFISLQSYDYDYFVSTGQVNAVRLSGTDIVASSITRYPNTTGQGTSVPTLVEYDHSTGQVVYFSMLSSSNESVYSTVLGGTLWFERPACIGISNSTVADTETADIIIDGGVYSSASGLTPGEDVFVDWDGNFSHANGSHYIGKALSATQISVTPSAYYSGCVIGGDWREVDANAISLGAGDTDLLVGIDYTPKIYGSSIYVKAWMRVSSISTGTNVGMTIYENAIEPYGNFIVFGNISSGGTMSAGMGVEWRRIARTDAELSYDVYAAASSGSAIQRTLKITEVHP